MEKILYMAFFEEIEIIQKGNRTFPSLRAPFRSITKDQKSFVILINVDKIDFSSKTFFDLKIFAPNGEDIYFFGLNGYQSRQENQFIICEVKNIDISMIGEYKVIAYANNVEIGESSFHSTIQRNKING